MRSEGELCGVDGGFVLCQRTVEKDSSSLWVSSILSAEVPHSDLKLEPSNQQGA